MSDVVIAYNLLISLTEEIHVFVFIIQFVLHVLYFFLIFSTPPVNVLKEILFNIPRVSFYGFLMAIAKSERINEHIGMDKGYTVTLQLWTALHLETENLCIKILINIISIQSSSLDISNKQDSDFFFKLNV